MRARVNSAFWQASYGGSATSLFFKKYVFFKKTAFMGPLIKRGVASVRSDTFLGIKTKYRIERASYNGSIEASQASSCKP